MQLKTPIAALHNKELNIGFFPNLKSSQTAIIVILLIAVISITAYFIYKKNKTSDENNG